MKTMKRHLKHDSNKKPQTRRVQKIMTNDTIPATIKVNRTAIEKVENYVYLGQEIRMGKENQVNEIERRIGLMWAAHTTTQNWI